MEQSYKKSAVQFGLILGVILAILSVATYAMGADFFSNWTYSIGLMLLSIVIIVVVGILAVSKARKILGGFISFKGAFTAYFITIAIGLLISTVLSIALYNFVDPDAAAEIKRVSIESTQEWMENANVPDEQIEKQIAAIEGQDLFGIGTQLFRYLQNIVIMSIFGLIVAAVMKRKEE